MAKLSPARQNVLDLIQIGEKATKLELQVRFFEKFRSYKDFELGFMWLCKNGYIRIHTEKFPYLMERRSAKDLQQYLIHNNLI